METRTVKIRAHTYITEADDPRHPGSTRTIRRLATHGEEVEVSKAESLRGDSLGAFYTDEDEVASEESPSTTDQLDFSEAGEDELTEWIEEENPNVGRVVEAADGDPDIARRLLAAEEAAGDPRKGVVVGLGAIINRDQ